MKTIRLTSKRQATFPKELCLDMDLKAGDALCVETIFVEGEKVWCLRRVQPEIPAWYGALRNYSKGKRHDMASVRTSIAESRAAKA